RRGVVRRVDLDQRELLGVVPQPLLGRVDVVRIPPGGDQRLVRPGRGADLDAHRSVPARQAAAARSNASAGRRFRSARSRSASTAASPASSPRPTATTRKNADARSRATAKSPVYAPVSTSSASWRIAAGSAPSATPATTSATGASPRPAPYHR